MPLERTERRDFDSRMTASIITFDESDGLFQSICIFVTVIEDVGADGEAGRFLQQRINLIDCVEHSLQCLIQREAVYVYSIG